MEASLITRKEFAKILGVSEASIRRKNDPASPYYLPEVPTPIKLGYRSLRYRIDEIEAWLNASGKTEA